MNSRATIDLPLKTIVSLIIGLFALFIVVAYIQNLKPSPSLVVSWDKDFYEFDGNEILMEVSVTDEKFRAIDGASVIIKGLGSVASAKTQDGKAIISFMPKLDGNEGYLDIEVSAIGYEKYEGKEQIKIVRKC